VEQVCQGKSKVLGENLV